MPAALDAVISDFGTSPRDGGGAAGAKSLSEVTYFLNIMFAAQFFDWAFLLAFLLVDEAAVTRILEEVKHDCKKYPEGISGIMQRFASVANDKRLTSAHKNMFERFTETFQPATPASADLERELPSIPDETQCIMM